MKILVLGAGYAGVMAALRLSGQHRKLDIDIRLVNPSENFIERPRLHMAATGVEIRQRAVSGLIKGTGIIFVHARVTDLDTTNKKATLLGTQGFSTLDYDVLIYALGSQIDQDAVPGIRENAHVLEPFGDNGFLSLQEKLQTSPARVVVIGGGATGIETAAEIKGRFPRCAVSIITSGRFAAFKGPRVERHIRESFSEQGIATHENAMVSSISSSRLILKDSREIAFDVAVWAGGFVTPTIGRKAGLSVNDKNQVLVDPYGRSISHKDIYAVGDASHPVVEPGNPVRMSLLTAITRGVHAADNIICELKEKSKSPLGFAYYGQGIAMGPSDAVGFLGFPDDKPRGIILRGKLAVGVRNFFVALLFWLLLIERKYPGFYTIIGKGRYRPRTERARLDQQTDSFS